MPRWPEQAGLEAVRLDGFTRSGDTFTLAFDAADGAAGERVSLVFDGVATVCVFAWEDRARQSLLSNRERLEELTRRPFA